ncbi:hypothetical protein PENTCL1PPCAC_25145, partial [Pristionchus entomophagus]
TGNHVDGRGYLEGLVLRALDLIRQLLVGHVGDAEGHTHLFAQVAREGEAVVRLDLQSALESSHGQLMRRRE